MTLTLEQKERFLRNRRAVNKIILQEIRKEKAIIFGAKSVNKQVPKHLQTHTEDFDILTKDNPKRLAKRIERRLDKRFKGNFYEVKPAQHPGTHKIINRLSGKGIVDTSKQEEKVGFVKRKGVRYARLRFQEKKIRQSLADPESKFRHQKDRFSRDRIRLARKHKLKLKRRRKRKRVRPLRTNFSGLGLSVGTSRLNIMRLGL